MAPLSHHPIAHPVVVSQSHVAYPPPSALSSFDESESLATSFAEVSHRLDVLSSIADGEYKSRLRRDPGPRVLSAYDASDLRGHFSGGGGGGGGSGFGSGYVAHYGNGRQAGVGGEYGSALW